MSGSPATANSSVAARSLALHDWSMKSVILIRRYPFRLGLAIYRYGVIVRIPFKKTGYIRAYGPRF